MRIIQVRISHTGSFGSPYFFARAASGRTSMISGGERPKNVDLPQRIVK
jgi:hypothetical protein